ncbi:MAG: CHAP domain-containing protein [Armatimonadetes bacterium]|nr:CHAP domain-containing protein [Armatimonadota bacterium]
MLDIKIPELNVKSPGSSAALKAHDLPRPEIEGGAGPSPSSPVADRFQPSKLLSVLAGNKGAFGTLGRFVFGDEAGPSTPDPDPIGGSEPPGNDIEPADPGEEPQKTEMPNEPLQAQSEDPSKPGYVPPDSLVGTKGGQCVGFVQKQLGVWFPVESAGQMLDDDKHPGFDRVEDPQPGDIFVRQGTSSNPDGHTGFVKSVDDEYVYVIDSNSNWDETVQVHKYRRDQIDGYLRKQPAE